MKFVIKRVVLMTLLTATLCGCSRTDSIETLSKQADDQRNKTGPQSEAFLQKLVAVGEARVKANQLDAAHDDFLLMYNTTCLENPNLYKGIAAAKLAHLSLLQEKYREAAPLGKEAVALLPEQQKERRVEAYHDLALCYWSVGDQRDITPFKDRGNEFARACVNIDIPTTSEYYPLKAEINSQLQAREKPSSSSP